MTDLLYIHPQTRELGGQGELVWVPPNAVVEEVYSEPDPDDPMGAAVVVGQRLAEMPVSEAVSAVERLVEQLYTEALRAFTRHASPEEMATWPLMAEKAAACKAGDTAACGWLARQVPDAVAQAEGLPDGQARALWLATKVAAKRSFYENAVAEAKAARAEGYAALAAGKFKSDIEVLAFAARLLQAAQQRMQAFMAGVTA